MAIAFVAIVSAIDDAVASVTYSKTIAAGSDIWLIVTSGVESGPGDADSVPTGITFDGNALTKIVADPNIGRLHSELYAKSETAKTANVVVSYPSASAGLIGTCAVDYTGADGVDVTGSIEIPASTNVDLSITTNTNNSYVLAFCSSRSPGAWTEDASQTSRKEFDGTLGTGYGFWDILKATAGAQAMDVTAPGNRNGMVAAELKEKAAGGAAFPYQAVKRIKRSFHNLLAR